jgi:hypothetical protein
VFADTSGTLATCLAHHRARCIAAGLRPTVSSSAQWAGRTERSPAAVELAAILGPHGPSRPRSSTPSAASPTTSHTGSPLLLTLTTTASTTMRRPALREDLRNGHAVEKPLQRLSKRDAARIARRARGARRSGVDLSRANAPPWPGCCNRKKWKSTPGSATRLSENPFAIPAPVGTMVIRFGSDN